MLPDHLIALIVLGTISLFAFAAYALDKTRARHGFWRTPEATLLSLGFFGGAAGALLGMYLFRHKTKHWYFWVVNILALAWQTVLVLYLVLN